MRKLTRWVSTLGVLLAAHVLEAQIDRITGKTFATRSEVLARAGLDTADRRPRVLVGMRGGLPDATVAAAAADGPGFLFLARFSKRRLNLPLIVTAPVFWVGLEYIRAFILTGFPWYYLAHSQYRIPHFTQIADFSGALGLSFLIALVNAYWVDLLTLPLFR